MKGERNEEKEKGETEARVWSFAFPLLPSETPKTETNHDNDSHETLFETRATQHTVHVLHAQDVCLPFPAILSDGKGPCTNDVSTQGGRGGYPIPDAVREVAWI